MKKRQRIKGIYRIISPSGSIYIGQSIDIIKRWRCYQRRECKSQTKLYASFKKYSPESHSFEIVHELPSDISKEILDQYEQVYIDQYREVGYKLLNTTLVAGGSMTGFKHSEETKYRMRQARKGQKTTSAFQRKRIIECNKSRIVSESTKKRISESRTGKTPWNKGVTHSEESRKKISAAMTGKKRPPFTEETRQRMSIAFTGRKKSKETIEKSVMSKKLNRLKRTKQISIWQ